MGDEIDTFNYWFVTAHNDRVVLRNPPQWDRPLTPNDALLLAAWLVVGIELAELSPRDSVLERLAQVVRAIENA